MKGTYSSKEFRVTPARSHSEQGSIRIFVCVCPSNASAMDQRDRVYDWPGARRAVTCATITSNKALGAVADGNPSIWLFQENCRRSENCRQEVGACVCPIGESTGKFGFAYSTVQQVYYVDPAKNGATAVACPGPQSTNTVTTIHPFPLRTFGFCLFNRLQRWHLLHPLRNGSLTSVRPLPQSQSRVEFQTLLDSRLHLQEAR
jgi:hypothetical protein